MVKEEVQVGRPLKGMKEICQYSRLSEATIISLIKTANFPAKKTSGVVGIWISNTASIDRWTVVFCESKEV